MSRLPFDPSRAHGAPPPEAGDSSRRAQEFASLTEADVLTVSQLSSVIKRTLEQRVAAPLRVIGEVSNLHTTRHWYFSLKDAEAVVGCVAWASSAARFGFVPVDGQEVIATGHVSYYGPQGRTQLYVSDLRPVGAGELELRFRAMCEELRKLGYFDDERKRPLPLLPRRIAVITSASGAAVADVVATAGQRCPAVGLLVVDVRVQGEGAAEGVARAIRWVNARRSSLGVDAILVTRGGGSIEDLWAFNERVVADAALASDLPLVAAIGHESDTTVIELVADLRAATPTQAIVRLVPDRADLLRQVDHVAQRLRFLAHRRLERGAAIVAEHARHLPRARRQRLLHERARLESLAGRWSALRPPRLLEDRRRRLAILEDRLARGVLRRVDQRHRVDAAARDLDRAATAALARRADVVDGLAAQLEALDPRGVLQRGFTYTTDRSGRLVRSAGELRSGQEIVTHLADGAVTSVVRGDADGGGGQMDLFGAPK